MTTSVAAKCHVLVRFLFFVNDETDYDCTVGLALQEQVIADDQQIPTSVSDWPLDALIIGDGEILR